MIYTNFERTDWAINVYPESTFEFIERSAWPIARIVRELTNRFSSEFSSDVEFISKLKSKSNQQHNAAMMELLLYHFLKNSGVLITKVERQRHKTPDFEISMEVGGPLYLECTLAASAMESQEAHDRKASVVRFLEEIPDLPFYVSANFNMLSDQSISKRRLISFIRRIVADLAPGAGFNKPTDEYFYEGEGWLIGISLIAKPNLDHSRTAGIQMQPATIIDNFTPLFSALNSKKPGRYGIVNKPYVICVGIDDMTVNEFEFSESLFGNGMAQDIYLDWPMRGFFLHECKSANTTVSAVLFCKTLKEFHLDDARFSLWHNPYAKNPISHSLFPVTQYWYEKQGERLIRRETNKEPIVLEILGINAKDYSQFKQYQYRHAPQS